jgi:hypothetical protein
MIREWLFFSILPSFILAVTVIPSTLTLPRAYINTTKPTASTEALYSSILRTNDKVAIYADGSRELWRPGVGDVYVSQDSFVHGVIDAGIQHQHLIIRPEDVWFTILTQLNFWLRRFQLLDDSPAKAPKPHIWGEFTWAMEKLMEDEVVSKDKTGSLGWLGTNFSTKAWTDQTIANALFVASSVPAPSPASREIVLAGEIGIPSITLSGVQSDWELLVQKLNKLEGLGGQPASYSHRLRPILKRFVMTFQEPNSREAREFWDNAIIQRSQSSPDLSHVLTGWLGGFIYWDPAGYTIEHDTHPNPRDAQMTLDKSMLPWHRLRDLPSAYSSLRMCWMDDRLSSTDIDLVAGMMAKGVRKGIPEGYEAAMRTAGLVLPSTVSQSDHSILRPLSLYFGHSRVKVTLTQSSGVLRL